METLRNINEIHDAIQEFLESLGIKEILKGERKNKAKIGVDQGKTTSSQPERKQEKNGVPITEKGRSL